VELDTTLDEPDELDAEAIEELEMVDDAEELNAGVVDWVELDEPDEDERLKAEEVVDDVGVTELDVVIRLLVNVDTGVQA